MSEAFERLLAEAVELPTRDRAELATRLISSLDEDADEPEDEVQRAWDAEIRRRVTEMDAGTAEMIPVEEVLAELRAELRDLHHDQAVSPRQNPRATDV